MCPIVSLPDLFPRLVVLLQGSVLVERQVEAVGEVALGRQLHQEVDAVAAAAVALGGGRACKDVDEMATLPLSHILVLISQYSVTGKTVSQRKK